MFEINKKQLAAQERQISAWRIKSEAALGEVDNELFREALKGMTPALKFAPGVMLDCYPTLWSSLN